MSKDVTCLRDGQEVEMEELLVNDIFQVISPDGVVRAQRYKVTDGFNVDRNGVEVIRMFD